MKHHVYLFLGLFAGVLLAACGMSGPSRHAPTAEPSPTGAAPPLRAAQVESTPVLQIYGDGTWRCTVGGLDCLVLATPTATPTAAATNPPTPTATLIPTNTLRPTVTSSPSPTSPTRTPTATLTPPPTNTPRPAATDTPEPTPTLEDLRTPSPTPRPTSTPTPTPTTPPGGCLLQVTADALNVRSGPGTSFSILGQLHLNDYLKPEATQRDAGGVLWYQFYWQPGQAGWVSGTWVKVATGANCSVVAWLIHVVPGVNRSELYSSYPVLASADIPFGVKSYADMDTCLQTLAAGGVCIFRWPVAGDCPASIGAAEPVASAQEWMQKYSAVIRPLMGYAQSGRLWIELVNECYYGSGADVGVFYWWQTWLDTAVTYAAAHGWPPVVAPTFGPGAGDDPFLWSVWKPAILKLAAAGGLVGFHAYTPYESGGLCACSEWLGCRHRRNYAALQAAGIEIGYAITEAARGWGNDPVDLNDFICWWQQVKYDPGLRSVALWIGGNHVTWPLANLDGHYVSLAQKIAQ